MGYTTRDKKIISKKQGYRKGTLFAEYLNRRIDYLDEVQKESLSDLPLLQGIELETNDENSGARSYVTDDSDFFELLKSA